LLFCLSCVSTALRWQSTKEARPHELAKIFVINLDSRKDRCQCASFLLGHAPYAVSRSSAATPETWTSQCPDMFAINVSRYSHEQAPALLCSNYRIWKDLEAKPDTEFAIVLEDDFLFLKPEIWQTLHAFLLKGMSQDWDIVYVDPKDKVKSVESDLVHMLTAEEKGVRGSHMMIVRTSSVSKLISVADKDYAPMDKFATNMAKHDVKVAKWTPGIVDQYTALVHGATLFPANHDNCKKSAIKSDIQGHSFSRHTPSTKETKEPKVYDMAFEC